MHFPGLERARAAGAVAPAPAVAALVEAERFPWMPARDVGVEVAPGGEAGGQEGVANPGFPDRVEPLAAAGGQPEDDRVRAGGCGIASQRLGQPWARWMRWR